MENRCSLVYAQHGQVPHQAALDLSLAALVRRAQEGDQSAFDTIYQCFADPLFRYLYARCASVELAEDLTGDLWVQVVKALPSFRIAADAPETVFAAWLYRIARNLLTDLYRRKAHTHVQLDETVASSLVPPDERVLVGEEWQELRDALATLTPEQREVVMLRFVEERSAAEVAQLTERSEGAVRVMQHRALDALARALGTRRTRAP